MLFTIHTFKIGNHDILRTWIIIHSGYSVNQFGTVCKDGEEEGKKGREYIVSETAERLGVSVTTVHNSYIKRGLLRCYKDGRLKNSPLIVSEWWLDDFIQRQQWDKLELCTTTEICFRSRYDIFDRLKEED